MSRPAYSLSFSGSFPRPPEVVFELFTDLTRMHLWNASMLPITSAKRMAKDLTYTAQSVATGELTQTKVTITELIPGKEIRMHNSGNAVSYDAVVFFEPEGDNGAKLTCSMKFSLPAGLLEEAREVVEAMAEARIRGNWNVMRALLTEQKG